MVKIVSLIKYDVQLKSDSGYVIIKGSKDPRIIGDGVTEISDNVFRSVMKYHEKFINKCIKKGSLSVSTFGSSKKQKNTKVEEKNEEKTVDEVLKKVDDIIED